MTRGELKTIVRKKLGEATPVFFEETDLNLWINNAQIDLVWNTRCKRQRSLCTPTADKLRYSLQQLVPNALRVLQVRIYSGDLEKWRRLGQKDYDFLDRVYPQWESNDAATPLYYVYDKELDEFILFPKAQSDYIGANYLEIYNSPLPTALTDDNQMPDIPIQLQPAITEYVVATGLEARGYQDIADNHWGKYAQKWAGYMTMREVEEDEEICMHGER